MLTLTCYTRHHQRVERALKYADDVSKTQEALWSSSGKMDSLKNLNCILIILQRTFLIQGQMSPLSVVKNLNILKDGLPGLSFAVKSS